MKKLTIIAPGINDELQPYHVINPLNLIVTSGEVMKPSEVKDAKGQPVPIKEKRTFVYVGGKPIHSVETVDEILAKLEEIE